jgi:hypothetical protein
MESQITTELENRILEMLLAGDDSFLGALRSQLDCASIEKREFTGHGFFTHFQVPDHVPRLPNTKQFVIGDVHGELSGVLCGFLLFVTNGVVNFLEGFVYGDDQWPTAFTSQRLYYMRHSAPGSPSLVETDVRDSTALWATLHTSAIFASRIG